MTHSDIDPIRREITRSIAVKQMVSTDLQLLRQVQNLVEQCLTALRRGNKIIFCGNGGSFGDAQHLAAEFISRFMFDRAPLAAVALGTNSSSLSAIGNDYGYDQVFARELAAIGAPGDIFVPISTSGNSPNVLEAVRVALATSMSTVGLTGESGGQMGNMIECIKVPSSETARIQECHILIGHTICQFVEAGYFSAEAESNGQAIR